MYSYTALYNHISNLIIYLFSNWIYIYYNPHSLKFSFTFAAIITEHTKKKPSKYLMGVIKAKKMCHVNNLSNYKTTIINIIERRHTTIPKHTHTHTLTLQLNWNEISVACAILFWPVGPQKASTRVEEAEPAGRGSKRECVSEREACECECGESARVEPVCRACLHSTRKSVRPITQARTHTHTPEQTTFQQQQ